MLQYNPLERNGEMSTLLQEKAYITDILGKDEVQTIPCAIVFSDGKEVKFWIGSFAETVTLETAAVKGEIYIIKFAIGASEVDYWSKKFLVIEEQWKRDYKWREWTGDSLSALRKKWSA
jgi:hypothetical protein